MGRGCLESRRLGWAGLGWRASSTGGAGRREAGRIASRQAACPNAARWQSGPGVRAVASGPGKGARALQQGSSRCPFYEPLSSLPPFLTVHGATSLCQGQEPLPGLANRRPLPNAEVHSVLVAMMATKRQEPPLARTKRAPGWGWPGSMVVQGSHLVAHGMFPALPPGSLATDRPGSHTPPRGGRREGRPAGWLAPSARGFSWPSVCLGKGRPDRLAQQGLPSGLTPSSA